MLRSSGVGTYFKNRLLRLYPGLLVCLLLTVILMSTIYSGSSSNYLENLSAWSYIPRNLSLFFVQYGIVGVFESNKYPGVINGSLWTLVYEFIMYIFVGIIMLVTYKRAEARAIRRALLIVTTGVLIFSWILFYNHTFPVLTSYLETSRLMELGLTFLFAALVAEFSLEKLISRNLVIIFALLLLVFSIQVGQYPRFAPISMVIISLWIGLKSWQPLVILSDKLGDISYGLYIYGFPIQQLLIYQFNLSPFRLLICSSVLTGLVAYLSWHLIEKRFLSLKTLNITQTLKPIWSKLQ